MVDCVIERLKDRWFKREELKELLFSRTGCMVQHTGWPCNTCFHSMKLGIDDDHQHELWLSTLLLRGDYSKSDIDQDDETVSKNIDELIGLLRA